MSNPIQIITTSDGSHSLLNTVLNETYHSVHGALQESKHVFIKNGLEFFSERTSASVIQIFEMGFGTGLNAMLTARWADQHQKEIRYSSLETFPLGENVYSLLNYPQSAEEKYLFEKLHRCKWNDDIEFENFILKKITGNLQTMEFPPSTFDIIYYDAFAPNKQPELWEIPILEKVISWMKNNSVFVTYCAKGQLKRDLKQLGLSVETLAGPPGKKEMVRGLKI